LSRKIKLTVKLINVMFATQGTATAYYMVVTSSWPVYNIRIDDRTGILWYPGVSDVWQLGQYRRSRVTDCHLFLAISLSLFDFGHYDSAQVLFTVRCSTPLSPISNSNTGNRKADRNPTPWELANAKSHWPFEYRFEILNAKPWMQAKSDHVAFMCTKEVNKNGDRPSTRI